MQDLHFMAYSGKPKPHDQQALSVGLLAHHTSQGHKRKEEKYSIFIRDKTGRPRGGIVITFLWNGMKIDSLWVDESIRRQGLGRKLLEAAEEEGCKRGCSTAYTDTFTWQAPEFYKKMGYSILGKLDNFPQGNTLYYFYKTL